jgi:hypothetical protein
MGKQYSWARKTLAVAAVLVIGAPGLLLACASGPSYSTAPRMARLMGPSSVRCNSIASYAMMVTFSDGSAGNVGFPPAGLSLNSKPVSGNTIMPTRPGWNTIAGRYSNSCGSVTCNRVINVW